MIADFEEINSKLFLSCNVGMPPHGDRSKLYELLLIYNDQWHVTGGSRLSLDAPANNVLFIYDLSMAGLHLGRLVASIQSFGEVACNWRQIISKPSDDAVRTDLPSDGMMIRI